ncbi:MAG: cell surface protein [Myxococcales bacterium]|nr:cell surface protein [Myxococcales bacterium]
MKHRVVLVVGSWLSYVLACGSADDAPAPTGAKVSIGDGGVIGAEPERDGDAPAADASVDGGADASTRLRDRFITKVVSFSPGACAGFGAAAMPEILFGPPEGAGDFMGSFDVVTLGIGGEIVVSFEPNAIVDGPGPDFIVFENAFYAAGNPQTPAADLAEVSVSDDGVTWKTYTCAPGATPPFAPCAGWTPVRSSSANGVSPFDPATAGGEAFDLADVGLARARFVRIRDRSTLTCPDSGPKPNNLGFDLDAIAVLHPALP